MGKVPIFKMRPQMGTLGCAGFVLLLGLGSFFNSQQMVGNEHAQKVGLFVLALCIVLSGLLIVLATSRMWFGHLWHDRYRKGPFSRK